MEIQEVVSRPWPGDLIACGMFMTLTGLTGALDFEAYAQSQARHKVLACFAGVLGLELGLSRPQPQVH